MKSNDWKSTNLRATRGGVRTGLTLLKANAPLLAGDLSGPTPVISYKNYQTYDRGYSDGQADCARNRADGQKVRPISFISTPPTDYERGYKAGYDRCVNMVLTPATSAAMSQQSSILPLMITTSAAIEATPPPPSQGLSRFFTNNPLSPSLPPSLPSMVDKPINKPKPKAGTPSWYTDATSAIGDKMWDAVTVAPCDDAFWLDRLSEFLRKWADEVERRAAACRGPKPLA